MQEFETIFKAYSPMVFRYLCSLCGDETLAEELTSETFYRAYLHIGSFRGECKVETWLCQIAKNALSKERRRQSRFSHDPPDTLATASCPFESVSNKEQLQHIQRHLQTLPLPYREVFSAADIRAAAVSANRPYLWKNRILGKGDLLPCQSKTAGKTGGTTMKESCAVVNDLLPLHLENCCSPESTLLVEAHLKNCPDCRKQYALLKSDGITNQTGVPDPSLEITLCAKKVRRHRRRVGFLTVLVTFLCACVLFISCLAVQDMHRLANPAVHPVEEGVYNLTASALETTAGQVENYILFTNYTQIQVSVPEEADFNGEVLLWDAQAPSSPIQYGRISTDSDSCVFSGLTSARRYMVTCDGDVQMPLTVSEGRNISFFHNFGHVLGELFDYATQAIF